jgi:membrane protease YdiL (CAAX protease family)
MKEKIPLRFFVVTFLWTWGILILCIILVRTGIMPEVSPIFSIVQIPIAFLAIMGPAVGTFVSLYSIEGKGAVKKYLKNFLSLNFGLGVWVSMFLISGISTFLSWIIPEFFGEARIPPMLQSIYTFPLFLLLNTFILGGQEEIGWRGYILPYLEKRFGLIIGSLILGMVWAVWHIPLWFIPGTSQSYMNFFAFLLSCIGVSYFLSWVRAASKNRLLSCLVAHGTVNSFVILFPVFVTDNDSTQVRFWIFCILKFIMGIIIVIYRHKNIKKQ